MTGARPGPDADLERRLSALLEARASLAPDADVVEAAAGAVGAARQRRRRRAGAGLVLGLVGLSAVAVPFADELAGGRTAAVSPHPLSPGGDDPAAPSPEATAAPRDGAGAVPWTVPADGAWVPIGGAASAVAWDQQDVDAFTAAGFTYDDAVALAELWQHPGDTTYAKVHGGEQLLRGGRLPLVPGSSPARSAQVEASWRAFAGSGLGVDDALELARLWDLPSGYQAALAAGEDLLAGDPLPVGGAGDGDGTADDDAARAAWRAADLDDADARVLAALWSLPDAAQAELAGGNTLLAGQPLPETSCGHAAGRTGGPDVRPGEEGAPRETSTC